MHFSDHNVYQFFSQSTHNFLQKIVFLDITITMSQRKCQPSSSTSHKNHLKNDQNSISKTSKSDGMNQEAVKNVAIAPDGSIFVKTLVHIDRKFVLSINLESS